MRCDLHVHSSYSGRADLPVLEHVGNECYSDPLAVYERAVTRGMDLVTLTDHDSIDGALRLTHLANTFISEEVSVVLPGGRRLHVNVFDITEAQHVSIQARRNDAEALFAWLAENAVPASVNHPFSALTGKRHSSDLLLPLSRLPMIETLNGTMPPRHNRAADLVSHQSGMAPVGGSDAHSLAHVARGFTTVPGAATKAEFLDGLRRGHTIPAGRSGSYARLTSEVARVFAAGYRQAARDLSSGNASLAQVAAVATLVPLLPLLPLFTLGIHLHELAFGRRHSEAFRRMFTGTAAVPLAPAPGSAPLEEAA